MVDSRKRVPVVFYATPSGSVPVREWLLTLPAEDRHTIGADIKSVEYGWPIGMPTCRPLGNGLWEVRSNLESHRIARVIFCVTNGEMWLLHGFIKKTQKTPPDDIALATTRRKEAGL